MRLRNFRFGFADGVEVTGRDQTREKTNDDHDYQQFQQGETSPTADASTLCVDAPMANESTQTVLPGTYFYADKSTALGHDAVDQRQTGARRTMKVFKCSSKKREADTFMRVEFCQRGLIRR